MSSLIYFFLPYPTYYRFCPKILHVQLHNLVKHQGLQGTIGAQPEYTTMNAKHPAVYTFTVKPLIAKPMSSTFLIY